MDHCPECGCELNENRSADPQRQRFFAILRDVYANISDDMRARFPNSTALRKEALIATGWCDSMAVVAGSRNAAPGIAEAFKIKDRYCIADARGDVVMVYTARSMSRRALKAKQFHDVAEAALNWIYGATGIDPRQSEEARS